MSLPRAKAHVAKEKVHLVIQHVEQGEKKIYKGVNNMFGLDFASVEGLIVELRELVVATSL